MLAQDDHKWIMSYKNLSRLKLSLWKLKWYSSIAKYAMKLNLEKPFGFVCWMPQENDIEFAKEWRSSKVQLDLENSETALGYNELYKTSCRKSEEKTRAFNHTVE